VLAAAAGLAALTSLLAACDKPQPTISVLSDGHATTVPAQPACTIQPDNPCQLQVSKQRSVTARSGGTILVSIAPELAHNGYVVTAFTSDGSKNTPLNTPGASTGPDKSLTVRLAVPAQAAGSYFLQVNALPASRQFTTYLVLVNLTA